MKDRNLYQVHVDGKFVVNVWAVSSERAIAAAQAQTGRRGRVWNAVQCCMEYYARVLQAAGFAVMGGKA
jgi:hypothetical protein